MKHRMKTTLGIGLMAFVAGSYAAVNNNTLNHNTTSISPAERAKIEQVVQEFLMKKPQVIIQAVQKLQQQQYDEAKLTVRKTQETAGSFSKALFHQPNNPVGGQPDGKITIVEFFDYQCQHCKDMAPIIKDISTANPNVRIVYKDFPIRGPVSEFAAKAAIAANKQGKYEDFKNALLSETNPLTQELVLQIAAKQGINVDQLKKDMNDSSVNELLKANIKLAKDLKLFGTPAIFIGKTDRTGKIEYVPGQLDQKQLQTLIDKANQ